AASQEQSAGIEQVNQAITQMDDVTQQNAALVEQAAAAAESLEEQANALAQAVSVFKLDGSGYSQRAQRPLVGDRIRTTSKNRPAMPAPAARSNKLAVAHSSDGEWETF
ncbi:MAG: hypothetical protein KJ889_00555, partial [Gammaproteobacteria bacterium]|nr:hypothetical protein [Gammaproteobacteria bacterium]